MASICFYLCRTPTSIHLTTIWPLSPISLPPKGCAPAPWWPAFYGGLALGLAAARYRRQGKPVPFRIRIPLDFLSAVGEGKSAAPTFRDALLTDQVTDAVLASARDRNWAQVAGQAAALKGTAS